MCDMFYMCFQMRKLSVDFCLVDGKPDPSTSGALRRGTGISLVRGVARSVLLPDLTHGISTATGACSFQV